MRLWCRDRRPKTAIRDNGPLQGRILSRRQGRAGEGGNAPHRQKRYDAVSRNPTSGAFPRQYPRFRRLRPSIFPACLLGSSRRPPGCSHCVARSFVPSRAPRRPRRLSCGCVRPRTSSLAMSWAPLLFGALFRRRSACQHIDFDEFRGVQRRRLTTSCRRIARPDTQKRGYLLNFAWVLSTHIDLGTWGCDASSRFASPTLRFGPSGDTPQPQAHWAFHGLKHASV